MTVAALLVGASAAIILLLGLIHLLYTFHGNKLHPRDTALQARLQEVSPVLTRETTMWRAWVGFNASHSYGAILFGLVYGWPYSRAPSSPRRPFYSWWASGCLRATLIWGKSIGSAFPFTAS